MRVFFSTPTKNQAVSFGKVGDHLARQLRQICTLVRLEDAGSADLQIYFGIPHNEHEHLWRRRCRRYLFYTMCESRQVPREWIDTVNTADGLITPSTFCDEIYRDLGVKVPRYVVPHAIDPEEFSYILRPEDRKIFTFLWMGISAGHLRQLTELGYKTTGDRKRGWMVRQAFEELDLPDSRLILKSIPYPTALKDFYYRRRDGQNTIRDVAQWMTVDQMRGLFEQADCFVWPTWGEGQGMIPLEAMATGLPAILPDYSGVADYFDRRFCLELPYTIGRIWESRIDEGALIDIEDVKKRMLWAYEHREEARVMGDGASLYVHDQWTWGCRVRNALSAILKQYERAAA